MENEAVFTIRNDGGNTCSLLSKKYNTYNKYCIKKADLFNALGELTDIFNNVLGLAIVFEMED